MRHGGSGADRSAAGSAAPGSSAAGSPASGSPAPGSSGSARASSARAVHPGSALASSARGEPVEPRAGRAQRLDVQLAWARDRDGAKLHVARIDPEDRGARGPFSCLGCGEPLVPHLGARRARHFAHLPGSACPLTAPETALHLDVKEKLLALAGDAFAGRRRVLVLARCPACRQLAPRDLAEEGDAAEAEGAVGSLRADVLVLRAGAPRLALEVLVTHAVDAEKEAALAAAGVPAVEVDAREEWLEEDPTGEARVICARSLGFAPCGPCAAKARAEGDRGRGGEAAEIAELEAYRARGLFGPMRPARTTLGRDGASAQDQGVDAAFDATDRTLDPVDRAALAARFACPECGATSLAFGDRIARHACPGKGARPVAWRGYDGTIVELSWWRRGAR